MQVGYVTRMLRGSYEKVTDLSGVSLACYEDVTRKLRGSYEETAPMEFSLYKPLTPNPIRRSTSQIESISAMQHNSTLNHRPNLIYQ